MFAYVIQNRFIFKTKKWYLEGFWRYSDFFWFFENLRKIIERGLRDICGKA